MIHSYEDQKSKIKVWAEMVPLESYEGRMCSCSPLVPRGLWTIFDNPWLVNALAFSLYACPCLNFPFIEEHQSSHIHLITSV